MPAKLFFEEKNGQVLAHPGSLEKLEFLWLTAPNVTNAGAKKLAQMKSLTGVYLYDTQMTDEGLLSLASLENLQSLVLSGNKITDAGIGQLKILLPKCSISNDAVDRRPVR